MRAASLSTLAWAHARRAAGLLLAMYPETHRGGDTYCTVAVRLVGGLGLELCALCAPCAPMT